MKLETTVIFVWWPLCSPLERDIFVVWVAEKPPQFKWGMAGEWRQARRGGDGNKNRWYLLNFFSSLFPHGFNLLSSAKPCFPQQWRSLLCFSYFLLLSLFQIFICLLKRVCPSLCPGIKVKSFCHQRNKGYLLGCSCFRVTPEE